MEDKMTYDDMLNTGARILADWDLNTEPSESKWEEYRGLVNQIFKHALPQDKAPVLSKFPCETCFIWRSFSDEQQSKAKAGEKQCGLFCSDYYEWSDRLNQRDADHEYYRGR